MHRSGLPLAFKGPEQGFFFGGGGGGGNCRNGSRGKTQGLRIR